MMIDLFKRMHFEPIENYLYVGFGSIAFIDFRMVHRLLGISDMISIENATDVIQQTRFEKNKPYANIKIKFGKSSAVLPEINFNEKRAIIWLDYDGEVGSSMLSDLEGIASRIKSGSFIGATFAVNWPSDLGEQKIEFSRLKEQFPDYFHEGVNLDSLEGGGLQKILCKVFHDNIERALSDADAGLRDVSNKRILKKVCFFKYKDGATMMTLGWIIVEESEVGIFKSCAFELLPFVHPYFEAFHIKTPTVTPTEIGVLEKLIPDIIDNEDLNWIPVAERKKFNKVYRYLPNYSVVESF